MRTLTPVTLRRPYQSAMEDMNFIMHVVKLQALLERLDRTDAERHEDGRAPMFMHERDDLRRAIAFIVPIRTNGYEVNS